MAEEGGGGADEELGVVINVYSEDKTDVEAIVEGAQETASQSHVEVPVRVKKAGKGSVRDAVRDVKVDDTEIPVRVKLNEDELKRRAKGIKDFMAGPDGLDLQKLAKTVPGPGSTINIDDIVHARGVIKEMQKALRDINSELKSITGTGTAPKRPVTKERIDEIARAARDAAPEPPVKPVPQAPAAPRPPEPVRDPITRLDLRYAAEDREKAEDKEARDKAIPGRSLARDIGREPSARQFRRRSSLRPVLEPQPTPTPTDAATPAFGAPEEKAKRQRYEKAISDIDAGRQAFDPETGAPIHLASRWGWETQLKERWQKALRHGLAALPPEHRVEALAEVHATGIVEKELPSPEAAGITGTDRSGQETTGLRRIKSYRRTITREAARKLPGQTLPAADRQRQGEDRRRGIAREPAAAAEAAIEGGREITPAGNRTMRDPETGRVISTGVRSPQREAPRGADTFNPIGERVRARVPRYGALDYQPGEAYGKPSAPGPYGRRPGDPIPAPTGEFARILREYRGGAYSNFFQTVDEYGGHPGPPRAATGTLLDRINQDDPKNAVFSHEDRHYRRVNAYQIADIKREQLVDQIAKEAHIPRTSLVGATPLLPVPRRRRAITVKAGDAEERRLETPEEVEARVGYTNRMREQAKRGTTENLFRLERHLRATKPGEGVHPTRTGYLNVGSVLPSGPEEFSEQERSYLEAHPKLLTGLYSRRDIDPRGPLINPPEGEEARTGFLPSGYTEGPLRNVVRARGRRQSKRMARYSREAISRARGTVPLEIFDPTRASMGAPLRAIESTGRDVAAARLSREMAEVISPRFEAIARSLEEGGTMYETGPLGTEHNDADVIKRNIHGRPIGRRNPAMTEALKGKRPEDLIGGPAIPGGSGLDLPPGGIFARTLSPEQTALHRVGQLRHDITLGAGYTPKVAQLFKIGPRGGLNFSAANRVDKGLRDYVKAAEATIFAAIARKRASAEELDRVQREPHAKREKQNAWTPALDEIRKIDEQSKGVSAQLAGAEPTSLGDNKRSLVNDPRGGTMWQGGVRLSMEQISDSGKVMPDEEWAAHEARRKELKQEQRDLQAKRIRLFRQRKRELLASAAATGGALPGIEGGVARTVHGDRIKSKNVRGRTLAGITERVPGLSKSDFTEGRHDSGDVYEAAANKTTSQAGANLAPQPARIAEIEQQLVDASNEERPELIRILNNVRNGKSEDWMPGRLKPRERMVVPNPTGAPSIGTVPIRRPLAGGPPRATASEPTFVPVQRPTAAAAPTPESIERVGVVAPPASTPPPPATPVAAAAGGGSTRPPRGTATTPPSAPPPPEIPVVAAAGGGSGGTINVRIVGPLPVPVKIQGAIGAAALGSATPRAARESAHVRALGEQYDRSISSQPLTTPAATAARHLAAIGVTEPNLTVEQKREKLRHLGYTATEADEFSGLKEARRNKKSTGTSPRATVTPRVGPAGPAQFALVGEPFAPTADEDGEVRTAGRRREKDARAERQSRRRKEKARIREEREESLVGDTDEEKILTTADAMRAKLPKITDKELASRLRKKGFDPVSVKSALGMPGGPTTRSGSLRASLGRAQSAIPGLDFGQDFSPERSGKSDARIAAETEILQARSLNPTRAFQTAVAAGFAKTIGGGGQFEGRVREYTRALNKQADVEESLEHTTAKLGVNRQRQEITAKASIEAAAPIDPSLKGGAKADATRKRNARLDALTQVDQQLGLEQKQLEADKKTLEPQAQAARQETSQKKRDLISPVGVARGFAALGAGAIVGGMVFSAASGAMNKAMEEIATAGERGADSLLGFAMTASKAQTQLAESIRTANGNVPGGLAAVAAPTGMSAAAFRATSEQGLAGRAQAVAAAGARVQESDLFRSAGFFEKNKLPGGYDKALFEGTGGPLEGLGMGSLLAGQPGFMERVAGDFAKMPQVPEDQKMGPGVENPLPIQQLRENIYSKENSDPFKDIKSTINNLPWPLGPKGAPAWANLGGIEPKAPSGPNPLAGIGETIDNLDWPLGPKNAPDWAKGIGGPSAKPPTEREQQEQKAAADTAADKSRTIYVKDVNDQLSRVNSQFKYVETSSKTLKDAMIKSAFAISESAGHTAEAIANAGMTIVGPAGRALEGTEFGQAAANHAAGQLVVSPEVAFETDKRSIEAQIRAIARDTQRQVDVTIPRDLALSNLAAPATPVGTGVPGRGGTPKGAGDNQAAINAGLSKANVLQGQLNARYAEGDAALRDALAPSAGLYENIEATGKAIAGLQAKLANESTTLQVHEYNNQLFMAKRAYGDILGLQNKSAAQGATQLGLAERENVELSRQSELLGQMLQQRQINFQLAIAGFKVAGQSPEERAERMKDARTQAEFAQKQLDLQKRSAGNTIRIFDLQNVNAARDALAGIALLREGRRVTINTKVAEEQLNRLNKRQADLVKQAGAYINKVDAEVGVAYSEIAKLEASYGKAINTITLDTITGFIKTVDTINANMPVFTPGRTAGGSWGPTPGDKDPTLRNYPHAAGFFGTTSGATSMTVGEAGPETVAILRNARSVTPSGMGGGAITININHPVVRDDTDIRKITNSVVQAINTRTALLGLR